MQNIVFDPNKRNNTKLRAVNRAKKNNAIDSYFLHKEASEILAERLSVTNRTFSNAALLFKTPFAENIENTLRNSADNVAENFTHIPYPSTMIAGSENLQLPTHEYDLIVSIFDLHWMNDLPGALKQINNALMDDGLFAGVLPSEGTLDALRECLVEAEMEVKSGASIRVDLFPQVRNLGDLLRRADFKLPVADVEQRTIRYSSPMTLVQDLRNIGATHMAVQNTSINNHIWKKALQYYSERYSDSDGKIRVEVNCTFLSGWKDHISQQKPLKPGSAKNKLSDFIKNQQ